MLLNFKNINANIIFLINEFSFYIFTININSQLIHMKNKYFLKSRIIILVLICIYSNIHSQSISINWNTVDGQVPDKMFGLNIWDGTLNNINNDLIYKSTIAELNLSIVRFHAYEMTQNNNNKSWYNTATQQWRTSVIDGCLQAQNAPNKLISIFNFPQWLATDGIDVKNMNVSNAQVYADWCANLVQIVNIQLGHNVKYWTVFNELESNFGSNIQDLATIYLACYTKMKLIDPTIKIGAFAISQPWWNNTAQFNFYQATKDNLDFIDYHLYGRDFSTPTNNILYNDANYLGYGGVDNVRNQATAAGVPLTVPIWLSETNIVYAYTNDPEGKMATNVGAVWDATLFESAIKAKSIQSIMLFNDRDGVYGKLSSNNDKRPAYENLKILSNNFYGNFVNSTTSDLNFKVLAVNNGSKYSVMVCNNSLINKNFTLNFNNGPANGSLLKKIDLKTTKSENNFIWSNNANFNIPSESISYFLFDNNLSTYKIEKYNETMQLSKSLINNNKIEIISIENTICELTINDLSGKQLLNVKNMKLNNEITNNIDISNINLSNGIYILKIITQKNIIKNYKIVIDN
jgi:hypothetical protein